MAAFDFPSSPTVGQSYAGYVWDGQKWNIAPVAATNAPASSANPKLWGVAVPGAATPYSREDHVHPADENSLAYSGIQVNGSFDVSQGVAGTTVFNTYFCDGWLLGGSLSGGGAVGATRYTTGPVPGLPGMGSMSVATAQASLTGGEAVSLYTKIEGYRFARLAWGTANAQPITIGFWSIHGRTGTYSVSIRTQAGPQRSYVAQYQHNVAGIAEYKTVTIPGCTDGTWANDNTPAVSITFAMAAGPGVTGAINSWSTSNLVAGPGQLTNLLTSDGFYLAGVIIVPGLYAPSAARSPLIMRPYDQELMTCKRYYQFLCGPNFNGQSTGPTSCVIAAALPVAMRGSPATVTLLKTSYTTASFEFLVGGAWVANASASISSIIGSLTGYNSNLNGFSGLVAGQPAMFNTGGTNIISLDARL